MTSSHISLSYRLALSSACLGIAFGVMAARAPEAHACGCFARPNPTVPLVQAGERILFAMEDGVVTAHVQIQYSGAAEEFAWLVPLPAEPTVGVGTDELFTQLIQTTQPVYTWNTEIQGICGDPDSQPPSGAVDAGASFVDAAPSSDSPLVSRDTVGPYDYAVLRADERQPLLDWLNQERFFVPAGTDDVMEPYIREGAFFLALKLRSDRSVGDLQPVVFQYQSELPMIPIVLTSVAADPDMPIQVWVLGDSRAIPRNFYHTQINDAQIDWLRRGANYVEVVTEAVDEADGHHSFITEYAGTSSIMRDQIDRQGRFGNLGELAGITDSTTFMSYLVTFGYPFGSQLYAILDRHLPVPPELAARGILPGDYYPSFSFYFDEYRSEFPEEADAIYADFDPAQLTAELDQAIVTPTRAAGQLFRDHDYLTRLFTTLSPGEMTKDPVFSFNPDLPEVSNVHTAQVIIECSEEYDSPSQAPARLITEQGWVLRLPNGTGSYDWLDVDMPASRRIEVLREEGAPEVIADKGDSIGDAIRDYRDPDAPNPTPGGSTGGGGGGCTIGAGPSGAAGAAGSGLAGLGLLGLAVVALLRNRSRRNQATLPRPRARARSCS